MVGGGDLIRGGLLYLLVDLISGLVEGVIVGGGRRRSLIRGGLLYFNFYANHVLFGVIYS